MTRTLPILPLAALGLATACADPQIEPTELIPTTLEVSPQSLDFDALFATARLEATVFDQNGEVMTGAAVLWQSSSFEVARVDQGGLVTAVDNGSAYIVAAAGEAKDSAQVGVQQRPHSVRITPPRRRTLTAIEDTVRLSASVLDPNGRPIAGAPVSWSSGDTTIVTVDEAGLVTSVATGTAFIRAALDNLADSVVTEVRQVPARVQILPADTLFAFGTLGDTLRLSAEVVDANGHPIPGLSVSWSTTSVLVAEIDREGLLTATGNGIAIITATALSARGSTRVRVEQVPCEHIGRGTHRSLRDGRLAADDGGGPRLGRQPDLERRVHVDFQRYVGGDGDSDRVGARGGRGNGGDHRHPPASERFRARYHDEPR